MINIKGAMLVNGHKCNIQIKDGFIENITADYIGAGDVISVPEDVYVSPGWIDLHTHAFPKYKPYCSYPDDIGYKTGVTTVVDAGTCGADDIDELHNIAKSSKTRVLSLLNISRTGLKTRNELADLSLLSYEAFHQAYEKYPDMIVGVKARMSGSVIGDNGIKPLEIAKQFAKKINKPLMVHIGSAPPKLAEIVRRLEKGDIITHCFNEKVGNNIFNKDQSINEAVLRAIERGVYLDIGHGTSSFSFNIAEKAKESQVPFDSISTDIYEGNRVNGPVYDMATTLNKFLKLGYTLSETIRSVTEMPAKIINQPELGKLTVGARADLTLFKVVDKEKTLVDSLGRKRTSSKVIEPYAVIVDGHYYTFD